MSSTEAAFSAPCETPAQQIARLKQQIQCLERENTLLKQQFSNSDASHYQALINSMQEGVILQNRQGLILDANPSAARILGVELKALKGTRLGDWHWQVIQENGETVPPSAFPVRRALREGVPNSHTILGVVRADLPILWLSINAQPLFHAKEKRPYAAFASFTDISQSRQIEHCLRHSEERFELAMQGANDGVWDINFLTDEVYFSPRWKQMLGYQDDELPNIQDTWRDRIHPDDYDLVMHTRSAYLQRLLSHYEFVHRLKHRDGHYLPILTRGIAVWDEQGRPCRMVGTHMDLSMLQETQRELLQVRRYILDQEQQIQAMLNISPDSIVVINDKGVIEALNPATEQLFGYAKQDLLGKNVKVLINVEDARQHDYYIQRYVETGKRHMSNRSRELAGVHRTGTVVPILLSIGEFEVRGQKKFAAFVHDISKQKQTERELQRARDVAEAANQSKSIFLATMSHEVRTPLNGILGMAELLREMGLTEEQQRYLDNIRLSGQSLLTIINDILDFSRLESNRLSLHATDFKLSTLVQETIDVFTPLVEAKGLQFNLEFDPQQDYTVCADPQRLKQILNNFINNALKFTEHGSIMLRVQLKSITSNQLDVLFEVIDTGIGIDSSALQHLFQPFSQVDDSSTRRYGGSGLGLAICKRLVTMFNGHIGVDSVPRQGSRFWFQIPLLYRHNQVGAEPVTLSAMPQMQNLRFKRGVHILVAEDNLINQIFIQEMLQRLGAKVVVAETGLEALTLLQRGGYDAVLMDCHMPEMDGLTAVEQLRQWEQAQQREPIPVVALTANAMSGERERCLASGMNDYLTKPVSRDVLCNTLYTWLDEHMTVVDEATPAFQPVVKNTPDTATPEIDHSILELLRVEIRPAGVNRLIDLYINELPNYFKQLQDAIEKQDAEALYLAAHKFKGASKNLGVLSVIHACEYMEALAKTAQLQQAQHEYQVLLDSLDELRPLLLAAKQPV